MKLFAVTVLYVKTDGTDCAAVAMVGAADAIEAIEAAAESVWQLPHCKEVKGGACEELDAPDAPAKGSHAQATYRPAGATVH